MKTLRILTGAHAGARLRLARERYVIGGGEQADIVITDWSEAPICIVVADGQPTQVSLIDAPPDTLPLELPDLTPRRFGDIALCVGLEEAQWPSDMELLSTLLTASAVDSSASASERKPGSGFGVWWRRRRTLMIGGSLCVALLAGFAGVAGRNGKAAAEVPSESLQAMVFRAVHATGIAGVTVHARAGGNVSVDGMVPDSADALQLRAALEPFPNVAHRYTSGTAVAQQIADALGNPGLAVRYRGDGEFVVTGETRDLESVRAKLRRIATDVGPTVVRVELNATELPPPPVLATNALMTSDDVRYVQTRDGTKHLVIGAPAATQPGNP